MGLDRFRLRLVAGDLGQDQKGAGRPEPRVNRAKDPDGLSELGLRF